jgi:2-polyprenyl-3-methyl-5-hydroxy-6-metoxy-1,4-benzoquinol methylase
MSTNNYKSSNWRESKNIFKILRQKWSEVPAGNARLATEDLLDLPDKELLTKWTAVRKEATTGEAFDVRGWYHALYNDSLKNKRVMDVGSGLGIDGITFAQSGAQITFVDIVESNISLLKRICGLLDLSNVDFHYMEDINSLSTLPTDYDVIWCQGSMINAPFDIIRSETQELLKHLPVGGRWIELAYPKERWIKEGELPFDKWGEKTDGIGTPWVEWYDLEKLISRLEPAKFEVVLNFNFHNDDFNWFDLLRRV